MCRGCFSSSLLWISKKGKEIKVWVAVEWIRRGFRMVLGRLRVFWEAFW